MDQRWCDCAYIAPEVRQKGGKCSRCKAAEDAMRYALEVARLLAYLQNKGLNTIMEEDIDAVRRIANKMLAARSATAPGRS